jgi:hypothetical protein
MIQKNQEISPQDLDVLLSEMVLLTQRCYFYHRFIKHRSRQELLVAQSPINQAQDASLHSLIQNIQNNPKTSSETGLPLLSALEETTKTLSNEYILLEEHYFKSNTLRAMQLDQPLNEKLSSDGPLLSSCVDDVFYLLKKCIFRAIASHDLDVSCALLQSFESLLRSDFAAILQKKLESYLHVFIQEPKAETRSFVMV